MRCCLHNRLELKTRTHCVAIVTVNQEPHCCSCIVTCCHICLKILAFAKEAGVALCYNVFALMCSHEFDTIAFNSVDLSLRIQRLAKVTSFYTNLFRGPNCIACDGFLIKTMLKTSQIVRGLFVVISDLRKGPQVATYW